LQNRNHAYSREKKRLLKRPLFINILKGGYLEKHRGKNNNLKTKKYRSKQRITIT